MSKSSKPVGKGGLFSSIIKFVLVAAGLSVLFTVACLYGNKQVHPENQAALSDVLPNFANTDVGEAAPVDATVVGDAVNKAVAGLQEKMKTHISKLENDNVKFQQLLKESQTEIVALRAEKEKLSKVTATVPPQHHVATSSDHIGGVAVTVLLHSPRWFQLRYTMMTNNIVASIPDDWKVQIFYADHGGSQKGMDLNIGLQKLVDSGKLVLTVLPREMVDKYHSKRIQYMVDPWLWNSMLADTVLVFGGNSVMCGNSPHHISDFFGYDYVGSPWNSAPRGVGGDGGISLRNRKVMLEALHYKLSTYPEPERGHAYKKWGMEDVFFVHTLLEMRKHGQEYSHIRIAPKELTMKWGAIGGYVDQTVLTASGTLGGVKIGKNRSNFIDYCLELKMIFPVLHDPGCFGAEVKKEQCAASICALSGKKSC